jgi:flavodoxin
MKKVWFIHNSQAGNTERLSNQFAEALKSNYDVKVGSIDSIKPEDIANDNLDAIVFATRVEAFGSDRKMTKYVKSLGNVIKTPIPKVATFYTHAMGWKKRFSKGMIKALEESTCIGETCPEFLELRLKGAEGPEREGQEEKIEGYLTTLKEFIG